jgi:hypothetical protein
MSALPIATVKSELSFEYQAACLLIIEPSHTSLEWMPMTPYKAEMSLQMASPVNRSLRREGDDNDGFQG